jgi:hypothetical protein
MGLDFIRRCAPTFTKGWNHGKRELSTPTLFTRVPGARSRSLVAQSDAIHDVVTGSQITVASEGDELVMLKGKNRVGTVRSVPRDVLQNVLSAGGITIARVGAVHPLSESFDVELQ